MSLAGVVMPELVRPTLLAVNGYQRSFNDGKFTPRERRLYIALAIILSINLSVICGALTFFGLLFGS
jgi:hypothetical protein